MRPLRVVHLPTAVGNQSPMLARAERALGLDSRAVCFHEGIFGLSGDEVVYATGDGTLTKELKRWRLLRRLLRDADVVHCNFGRCLTPVLDAPPPPGLSLRYEARAAVCRLLESVDLRLLRRAGKAIVVSFQGDDIRQGDACLERYAVSIAHEVPPGYYSPRTDARKRRRTALFDRYAHRLYALNPDLLHVLPARAEFLPYAGVDLEAWAYVGVDPRPGPLKLLHAPSHRGGKGTHHVLAAVEQVRARGLEVELTLVEGVPHDEVRELYEQADVLVDQVLAGFYGGLAVELMALGKPAIAYLRPEDLELLPEPFRAALPVLDAPPDRLADVLETLARRPREELVALGRRSRAFVERFHDPERVAAGLVEAYRDALGAAHTRS